MTQTEDKRKPMVAVGNRLLAAIFLIVICCGTLIFATMSEYTVSVIADGKTIEVTTSEQSVAVILKQAGVELGDKDALDISDFTVGGKAKKGNKISIRRAVPVKIIDDGDEVATVLIAGTVQDALDEAGVTCRPVDRLNCESSELVTSDMTIEITRAFSVDVKVDGKTLVSELLEGKVADVISALNITVGPDDEVSPSLKTKLRPGLTIHVYRVTFAERTETETIKFTTIKKTSSAEYEGVTKVEQEGSNGEKTVTYKDKLVDGKVSKTTKIKEEVVKPAINKIIVKGTKVKVTPRAKTISPLALPSKYKLENGIPVDAIKTYTGKSTAYHSNSANPKTASGRPAQVGYVAVDPKVIPYGSELYVVSKNGKYVYGYCIAADCGRFTHDQLIVDVYLDSEEECRQWGKRDAVVYVLSEAKKSK